MKILDLTAVDLEPLWAVYRETTADVPFCYPVTHDEFREGLLAPTPQLFDQTIVVGEAGGVAVGFAHIALSRQDPPHGPSGSIRFLGYRRGHRSVARAILEAAEAHLFGAGATHIDVPNHNYAFYRFDFGAFSDKMTHVCALLGSHSYEETGSWLLMERPVYRVEKPKAPDNYIEAIPTLEDTHAEHPDLTLRLMRDQNQIGACEAHPAKRFNTDRAAENTFYIGWMEVAENERGKGLGRFLLETTLWEMQERGYSNAALHTNCGNKRAQLLYTNMGFRVLDTSYEFSKSKSREEGAR